MVGDRDQIRREAGHPRRIRRSPVEHAQIVGRVRQPRIRRDRPPAAANARPRGGESAGNNAVSEATRSPGSTAGQRGGEDGNTPDHNSSATASSDVDAASSAEGRPR